MNDKTLSVLVACRKRIRDEALRKQLDEQILFYTEATLGQEKNGYLFEVQYEDASRTGDIIDADCLHPWIPTFNKEENRWEINLANMQELLKFCEETPYHCLLLPMPDRDGEQLDGLIVLEHLR